MGVSELYRKGLRRGVARERERKSEREECTSRKGIMRDGREQREGNGIVVYRVTPRSRKEGRTCGSKSRNLGSSNFSQT